MRKEMSYVEAVRLLKEIDFSQLLNVVARLSRPWVTTKELAASCGVATSTIRNWKKLGLITPVGKVGKSDVYLPESVKAVVVSRGSSVGGADDSATKTSPQPRTQNQIPGCQKTGARQVPGEAQSPSSKIREKGSNREDRSRSNSGGRIRNQEPMASQDSQSTRTKPRNDPFGLRQIVDESLR